MTALTLGLLIWTLVHWLPSGTPGLRTRLVAQFGVMPYRIGFAASILVALWLIVSGWRSIQPQFLYVPGGAMRHAGMLLVLVAFLVLGSFRGRGRLNQWLRHPQLTGVILWASGHLLANGENRSVLLFTGLLVWAVGSLLLINRRDGSWQKPASAGIAYDIRALVIGLVLFVVFLFAHPWITGIALL